MESSSARQSVRNRIGKFIGSSVVLVELIELATISFAIRSRLSCLHIARSSSSICSGYFSRPARQTCMNCEVTKGASEVFMCSFSFRTGRVKEY